MAPSASAATFWYNDLVAPDQTQDDRLPEESAGHQPVLLESLISLLSPKSGETIVDCTLGRAGHAAAIVEAAAAIDNAASYRETTVVGFDLDPANIAFAQDRLDRSKCRSILVHSSFLAIGETLSSRGLRADIVLADLGFASTQMDDPARGFSFQHDAPLDMRLDPTANTPTAADLLCSLSESELADLIFHVGEDPLARRIARKVVQTRQRRPIHSTLEFAQLVRDAYGSRARQSRMHPATRSFMALRIAVNRELEALDGLLEMIDRQAQLLSASTDSWLERGVRVGIISFHSHEDRRVKRAFQQMKQRGLATVLTSKPVVADEQEVRRNPRSRSAKLRVAIVGDVHHG